jgi:hypothetical protein
MCQQNYEHCCMQDFWELQVLQFWQIRPTVHPVVLFQDHVHNTAICHL